MSYTFAVMPVALGRAFQRGSQRRVLLRLGRRWRLQHWDARSSEDRNWNGQYVLPTTNAQRWDARSSEDRNPHGRAGCVNSISRQRWDARSSEDRNRSAVSAYDPAAERSAGTRVPARIATTRRAA